MKKILIVDDELEVVSVFEEALKKAGYQVKIASSGQSGTNLAKTEQFDLILLDQMMPDTTGNEMLKTLRSDPNTKSTPVALLTNFGHEPMVKEAIESQANDYILKYQISPEDLVVKVNTLLTQQEETSEE